MRGTTVPQPAAVRRFSTGRSSAEDADRWARFNAGHHVPLSFRGVDGEDLGTPASASG